MAAHYIFAPWFLHLSICHRFSSLNLSSRSRVDVYHGVALVRI